MLQLQRIQRQRRRIVINIERKRNVLHERNFPGNILNDVLGENARQAHLDRELRAPSHLDEVLRRAKRGAFFNES